MCAAPARRSRPLPAPRRPRAARSAQVASNSTTAIPTAHQASFDELGTPLRDVVFCVLDLETTGTDRTEDRITEIGAVRVRGGEVLGTFQTLVNPGRAIPPAITVLTGLTDAVVATAPRVEAVLGTLRQFIGDAVVVGHNVRFDLGFLRTAFERVGDHRFRPTTIDTVALARKLVRDEVPNCKLSTLAERFRLDHRPAHRALDDALATTDLLHLLIERAAGFGATGLDDLVALASLAGHAQAGKLSLTAELPRSPGVYLFRDARGELLYVGKATDLRQRVRSYFGSDDRRRTGPLLRELHRIDHVGTLDVVTAEVLEQRLIARHLPRYNRTGTRVDRYCYVQLDVASPWPRLSIVKRPATDAVVLGPITSRRVATSVVEALHDAIPLRRCTTRLTRRWRPDPDAVPCAAAQLGRAPCPCAGAADPHQYAAAVAAARRVLEGDASEVLAAARLRMTTLAATERYEEAAAVRDRAAALASVTRRHLLVQALRDAGRVRVTDGRVVWHLDQARLIQTVPVEGLTCALPVPPPDPVPHHHPIRPDLVDEALVLARHLDRHHARLRVLDADGPWAFPVGWSGQLDPLDPETVTGRSETTMPTRSIASRRTDASGSTDASAASTPSAVPAPD